MFIELTVLETGKPFLLNKNMVESVIEANGNQTRIVFNSGSQIVRESYEYVKRMLTT